MSAQFYSVTIKCEGCEEVVSQSGFQRKDATVSLLRKKIHKLGWKSSSALDDGKSVIHDFCPSCSYEHGVR